MYFPVRTEGHEPKLRPGLIGILALMVLIQLFSWRNKVKYASASDLLRFGPLSSCAKSSSLYRILSAGEALGIVERPGGVQPVMVDKLARRAKADGEEGAPASTGDKGILRLPGMDIARSPGTGGPGTQSNAGAIRDGSDGGTDVVAARLGEMRRVSLVYRLGLTPGHPNPFNFITSLFTHASWVHLAFTLWFMWLAGEAMERHWGTGRFVGIFLACGIVGGAAFMAFSAFAGGVPGFALVGPAGALAGIMSAYATTHRREVIIIRDTGITDPSAMRVSIARFFGIWVIAEVLSQLVLPGRGHGIALIASVAGGLAGWVFARAVPGSNPVFLNDAPRLSPDPDTDWVQYPPASAPSYRVSSDSTHASRRRASRGFDIVMESLAQSQQALRAGDTASASAHLYDALETALQPGSTDPMARENALTALMTMPPTVPLPPGALHAWATRLDALGQPLWAARLQGLASVDLSRRD
jgi:membrane associated rhomboid family serine protease